MPFPTEEIIYFFFTASRLPRSTGDGDSLLAAVAAVKLTTRSPPHIAKVKNEWSNILTSPYVFMAWCLITGTTFYFTFTCIGKGKAIIILAWTGP